MSPTSTTPLAADAAIPRAEALRRQGLLWKRLRSSRSVDLLAAGVAVLVFAAPMLFTESGFEVDFTNHLWITWVGGKALFQMGHPTYFIHTYQSGVFYPIFAFYGGTIHTVTGGLGELLGGHPVASYVAVTILMVAGTYGGTLWLGRQLGLTRWLSHVPALAVITSAYYVSDLYGRGAWTEFVAISAIPPLFASALYLTRSRPWRFWPVLIFVVSTVIATGSHNITLLWGTFLCVVALLLLWLVLGRPTKLPYRRLAMVLGLGVTCALTNAWFLAPDIGYAKDVRAHLETSLGEEGFPEFRAYKKPILVFDSPQVLFDPLREVPSESTVPALFVQVPDWFLIWALAAGVLLLWRPVLERTSGRGSSGRASMRAARGRVGQASRERTTAARPGGRADRFGRPFPPSGLTEARRKPLLRVWLGFAGLLATLLLIIMDSSFWDSVPYPFANIQFPFRLNSYVLYAVGALVLVGALAMQLASSHRSLDRKTKGLRIALIGVCVISVALCIWQEWAPNSLTSHSYTRRGEAIGSVNTVPGSWYEAGSYNDVQAPEVAVSPNREMLINPTLIHDDRFDGWVNLPPGMAPIQTNIAGGPYLVHTSGVTPVGRSNYGFEVVRRSKDGSGPVHVVVEPAHSFLLVLGWVMTILASAIVLVVLAWTIWTAARRRSSERPSAS
jgi:hypothetical protein